MSTQRILNMLDNILYGVNFRKKENCVEIFDDNNVERFLIFDNYIQVKNERYNYRDIDFMIEDKTLTIIIDNSIVLNFENFYDEYRVDLAIQAEREDYLMWEND